MITTYLGNNINYNRVYFAVAISIVLHSLLIFLFVNKESSVIYVENGVRAFDSPRISINISKIQEQKKVAKKVEPALTKEAPVKKEVIAKKIDKPVEEVAEEEKFQEAIPVIENATFKGKRIPPTYPKRALMLKQEGTVILQALIDINGNIKDIKVESSSGYAILDKSAIFSVRKWKFEPSMIDGKPSLSWVKVPVEFIIK